MLFSSAFSYIFHVNYRSSILPRLTPKSPCLSLSFFFRVSMFLSLSYISAFRRLFSSCRSSSSACMEQFCDFSWSIWVVFCWRSVIAFLACWISA